MRSLLAAALVSGAALVGAASASAAPTVVNPATPGWSTNDTTSPGVGSFVFGPAGGPLGSGSYKLDTSSSVSAAKVQYLTDQFDGTPVSSITGVGYSTYRTSPAGDASPNAAINIIVIPGLNTTTNVTIPYGTFVYEPYNQTLGNAGIHNGQWQSWDAYAGKWWTSKVAFSSPCGQGNQCSWATLNALFPQAVILPIGPAFGVNQGANNTNTVSYADGLYLSINGNTTTFDFEPTADTTGPSCGALVVHRGAHDTADVTITDAGSGIASITNFTVTNGTSTIPDFNQGDHSVTVSTSKGTQGQRTFFEFDVTDVAGNTTHCV